MPFRTLIEEHKEDITTTIGVVFTYMVSELIKHPISSLAAVGGLLFVYERYRTQKALRKKAEGELNETK